MVAKKSGIISFSERLSGGKWTPIIRAASCNSASWGSDLDYSGSPAPRSCGIGNNCAIARAVRRQRGAKKVNAGDVPPGRLGWRPAGFDRVCYPLQRRSGVASALAANADADPPLATITATPRSTALSLAQAPDHSAFLPAGYSIAHCDPRHTRVPSARREIQVAYGAELSGDPPLRKPSRHRRLLRSAQQVMRSARNRAGQELAAHSITSAGRSSAGHRK